MAADLGLVLTPPSDRRTNFRPSPGRSTAERGLAHARRADQPRMTPWGLDQLPDGEVLDDPLLDLIQSIVSSSRIRVADLRSRFSRDFLFQGSVISQSR